MKRTKSPNKRDNIILKSSAITIIDNVVVTVDNSINGGFPLLGIAWGLAKGMYGANIQLRQERAIEFVEMIRDNPNVFTKEILQTEEFQDGFVYTFQKYLSERVARKRKIIKNIFCGFVDNNKEEFKLERLLSTIEQISVEEMDVLKIFYDGTIKLWYKNQFPEMEEEELKKREGMVLNVVQIGKHILCEMLGMDKFLNVDYTLEVLLRLSNLGLLIGATEVTWDSAGSTFKQSDFGRDFTSFVLK